MLMIISHIWLPLASILDPTMRLKRPSCM